jgi:hypothetical protein
VVAGHRWTDEQIPDLLRQVNAAMAEEVEALAALSPPPPRRPSQAVPPASAIDLTTSSARAGLPA